MSLVVAIRAAMTRRARLTNGLPNTMKTLAPANSLPRLLNERRRQLARAAGGARDKAANLSTRAAAPEDIEPNNHQATNVEPGAHRPTSSRTPTDIAPNADRRRAQRRPTSSRRNADRAEPKERRPTSARTLTGGRRSDRASPVTGRATSSRTPTGVASNVDRCRAERPRFSTLSRTLSNIGPNACRHRFAFLFLARISSAPRTKRRD